MAGFNIGELFKILPFLGAGAQGYVQGDQMRQNQEMGNRRQDQAESDAAFDRERALTSDARAGRAEDRAVMTYEQAQADRTDARRSMGDRAPGLATAGGQARGLPPELAAALEKFAPEAYAQYVKSLPAPGKGSGRDPNAPKPRTPKEIRSDLARAKSRLDGLRKSQGGDSVREQMMAGMLKDGSPEAAKYLADYDKASGIGDSLADAAADVKRFQEELDQMLANPGASTADAIQSGAAPAAAPAGGRYSPEQLAEINARRATKGLPPLQ